MEYYWSLFNNCSNTARGHNGNFNPSHAWDLATTYYSPPPPAAAAFQSVTGTRGGGGEHSTMHRNPDPHPTCLKLGKRRCFGDLTPPPPPFAVMKRVKNASAPAVVPRCQVEGCEAVLVNAKDYHRRHKVCEMHAKAPTVVLLGIDQRFCQQCSRFHAVGAFDEAKRSCRRRLAGHNERRRKSSQEHSSFARKQYQEMEMVGGGRHPQPHLLNNSGCALSLLSPASYGTWSASPAPDRPSRCSAALRELIAENRASVYACSQFDAIQIGNNCKVGPGWAEPENRGHVTLNLMQGPDSAFGLFSGHGHRPSEEDGGGDCSELWKLPMGY